MEGMGLNLTPVVVRHLLGYLGIFKPMAGTSWTHIVSTNSTNREYNPSLASHPPT